MGVWCCDNSHVSKDEFKGCSQKNSPKKERSRINPSNGFQMPIRWRCKIDWEELDIPVKEVCFSHDKCEFSATGDDSEGSFVVEGTIKKEGEVIIKQTYNDKNWQKYEGKFEENILNGKWENNDKEGTFSLEVISKVWHSDKYFVALKSFKEPMGIAKLDYGFGIVHGTPSAGNPVSLTVTFGDGRTGKLKCTLKEDTMKVEVEVSNEKQILYLKAKNESE